MPDSPSDAPLPDTDVPTDEAEPYAAAVALYAALIPQWSVMTTGPED